MKVGNIVYIKKNCKKGHYYSGEIGIVTMLGDYAGENDLFYVQLPNMVNTPSYRGRIFKKMGTMVIERRFWFREHQVCTLPEKSP